MVHSDSYVIGALRSRVVSRLSGATPGQLRGWHRNGSVVASGLSGGRGQLRLYSWVDYCKARAAWKLLDQGLPARRLRANLLRLDQEIDGWYRLPLLAFQSHVIVPVYNGPGYTIIEKQGAMDTLIRQADRATRAAPEGDDDDLLRVVHSLQREGPLGRLQSFGEHVTMNPEICGASPIVLGTRIETAHIAAIHGKGFQDTGAIAARYRLSVHQVEAAVEFEVALAA